MAIVSREDSPTDTLTAVQPGSVHGAASRESRRHELKTGAVAAIGFLQVFLSCSHWFIYHTLIVFWPSFIPLTEGASLALRNSLLVLSVTFIVGTLLGSRFSNGLVSLIYKVASIWLGIANFLFWAAWLCWIAALLLHLAPAAAALGIRPWIGTVFFGAAMVVSFYGFINARIIRERRITVTLPNLPEAWRGRTALLATDLHLGNVNSAGFARRIANIARRLDPAIIFVAGDLYDGSKVDATRVAAPLFELAPPHGVYFSEGNHEDFGDAEAYTAALRRGGIRVLHNERVVVEGLHVIGVSYADSTRPAQLRAFLGSLQLDDGRASILLNHVPHRLPIVEKEGVSLQLSGHTHGGQIFPFTLVVRRVFGKFGYGLQRFGNLQVVTSSGAGTWGPPMRVGTQPEVVLITFA